MEIIIGLVIVGGILYIAYKHFNPAKATEAQVLDSSTTEAPYKVEVSVVEAAPAPVAETAPTVTTEPAVAVKPKRAPAKPKAASSTAKPKAAARTTKAKAPAAKAPVAKKPRATKPKAI